MLYSCFNQNTGLYDVYEDQATHPVNGDLPVPKLGNEIQGIGVPALEAGRPLPWGAKHVGTSWNARGIVVNCGGSSLGAISREQLGNIVVPVLIGASLLTIMYILVIRKETRISA